MSANGPITFREAEELMGGLKYDAGSVQTLVDLLEADGVMDNSDRVLVLAQCANTIAKSLHERMDVLQFRLRMSIPGN